MMINSSSTEFESSYYDYPSVIRLKAGVFHAPPFATVITNTTTTTEEFFISAYGLHLDLLESIKVYASLEGIELQVEFGISPNFYDDGINVIANDCNSSVNQRSLEECQQFDIILGDFWSNAKRYNRVDFTPPWLYTSMGTLKYIGNNANGDANANNNAIIDVTTLKEAEAAKVPVCVPQSTYVAELVEEYIAGTVVIPCDGSRDACIQRVKNGTCALYADDVLLLQYISSTDITLKATREEFRFQFLVWPYKKSLPRWIANKLLKWIYSTFSNGTMDILYNKYFTEQLCPIGTAGIDCTLPCHPEHGIANAQGICVCDSTLWTGEDCSIMTKIEYNLLPKELVQTCYCLVGINFFVVLGCAIWVIRNRQRAQVKVAQPTFLLLILLGCLISTSTIIALAQEDNHNHHEGGEEDGDGNHGSTPVVDYACMAVPWLYSIGFCITFGSLFAKIRRVYKLMQSACAMRRARLTTKETLMTVAMVLVVDVFVLLVWSILDPLKWNRIIVTTDKFGVTLESIGSCQSNHWKIFVGIIASLHLLLMAIACHMVYLARAIPERFSNSKHVGIAIFSNLQILLVGIPVLIIVESDPVASFFVSSVGIWINDFIVVLLIFGGLIHSINKFDRERSNGSKKDKKASVVTIQSDILEYAQKVRSSQDMQDGGGSLNSGSSGGSRRGVSLGHNIGRGLELAHAGAQKLEHGLELAHANTQKQLHRLFAANGGPPEEKQQQQQEEEGSSPIESLSSDDNSQDIFGGQKDNNDRDTMAVVSTPRIVSESGDENENLIDTVKRFSQT